MVKTRFLRLTSASFDVGIDSSPLDRGGRGGGEEWESTAKVLHGAPQVPCRRWCSGDSSVIPHRLEQIDLPGERPPSLTLVLLCACRTCICVQEVVCCVVDPPCAPCTCLLLLRSSSLVVATLHPPDAVPALLATQQRWKGKRRINTPTTLGLHRRDAGTIADTLRTCVLSTGTSSSSPRLHFRAALPQPSLSGSVRPANA